MAPVGLRGRGLGGLLAVGHGAPLESLLVLRTCLLKRKRHHAFVATPGHQCPAIPVSCIPVAPVTSRERDLLVPTVGARRAPHPKGWVRAVAAAPEESSSAGRCATGGLTRPRPDPGVR